MRKVEGTATISIDELHMLLEYEKQYKEIRRETQGLIESIDSAQFESLMKKIDDMPDETSDDEINRLIKEAAGTLKIIISEHCLRKLILDNIEENESEYHSDISKMTEEEFEKIPLLLGEKEKKLKEKIKKLESENSKLRHRMSYMVDPMAIGDRSEMGG